MSMFTADLMPVDIRRPERPQPINFAFRGVVDPLDVQMCRTQQDREYLFSRLKQRAAHELAKHIADHCKLFDVSTPSFGEMKLQVELTINDRGAYENWLPMAKMQGEQEGKARAVKEMVASLPYGLADAAREFYE